MTTSAPVLATRIVSYARPIVLLAATMVVVLLMAEAHIWWFASIENLLGCDRDALWCENPGAPGTKVVALKSLKLIVKPNAPVIVGQNELAQPDREDSAEEQHVEFSMTGGGLDNVLIRNIARRRHLGLTYRSDTGDEAEVLADRWYLSKGDVIRIGSSRLQVAGIDNGRIDLSISDGGGRFARFGGRGFSNGTSAADLSAAEKCRAFRTSDKLANLVSRWTDPIELLVATPVIGRRVAERPIRLSMGGPVDCYGPSVSHIRLDKGIRVDSVILEKRKDGKFFLTSGTPPGGRMPAIAFERAAQPPILGFSSIAWRLRDRDFGTLSGLVIGRTTYIVDARDLGSGGVEITLRPMLRVNYFGSAPTASVPTAAAGPEPRASPSRGQLAAYVPHDGIVDRLTASRHPLRDISMTTYLLGDFSDRTNADPKTTLSGKFQKHELLLYVGMSITPLFLWIFFLGSQAIRALFNWSRRKTRNAVVVFWRRTNERTDARNIPEPVAAAARSVLILAGLVVVTSLALAPVVLAVMNVEPGIDRLMALTIANWMLASIAIVWFSKGGWILNGLWLANVVLAAIGSIFLVAMAVDGNSSYWAAFFLKNKFLFLDTLPPAVWALATVEPRVMRPWIQRLIGLGDSGLWMRVVRWTPVLALFAAMMFWLFFGGQAGVEGFNPVEFGKFASIVILSAFLVGLDPGRLREFGDAPAALVWRLVRWLLFVVLMAVAMLLTLRAAQPLMRLVQDAIVDAPAAVSILVNLAYGLCLAAVLYAVFIGLRKFLGRDVVSTSLGFLLFLATASLFAVPAAQSDWSPVLIILTQGAVVFACYCFVSALRWLQFGWSYVRRRRAIPRRFLPLPTAYGAEILAIFLATLVVAILYVWMRPNSLVLLAVFAALLWIPLGAAYRILGDYSITNVLVLTVLPVIFGVLVAAHSQSTSYILPLAVGVAGLAVTFGGAKLLGWRLQATRWSRLAAMWPVVGIAVLIFMANYGIGYSLKFIGIPEWDSGWSKQVAMENLKKDYASSTRPAIIGRFISWADIRLGETAVVRYWDLGLQVIRSRAVIAAAPCGIHRDVMPTEPTGLEAISKAVDFGYRIVSAFQTLDPARTDSCGQLLRSIPAESPDTPLQKRLFDGSDPLRVPVVQFDFPAAFLIGRFGVGFAWALICVQGAFLLLGLAGFLQVLRGKAGSEVDSRARRFLSIVLLGSVTLFALHWAISWSNALGLMPVMGQPMSWLSAGVSHQILMVFPCVMAMIVALRYGRFEALALRFGMPPR
jgi:cell division protein FtsW (lipid II flippase)